MTYKYIGETNFFVKNGDILCGDLTTWSVKIPFSNERKVIKCLYVDGVGFNGESMSINELNLQEVKQEIQKL